MNLKIVYVDNFLTGSGHTPTTGATLVKLFKQEDYNVIATSSRKNKLFRLLDMVRTIVANRRNSVILIAVYSTSAFYFAFICASICRLLSIPYIACLHGGNLPERIKRSPLLSKAIFGHSSMNVAVSGYLRKSLIENNWKSIEIPNNINIAGYPFKQRSLSQPKLLWVRSFHKIYNPALAIKVFQGIKQKYSSAKLTMVGPDKDGSLEQCRSLTKDLNLEEDVEFTGLLPVNEWTRLAADYDIFLNTTNFDNLPVSIIEAMALGMVVITTDAGGIPYLIENGKSGFIVPRNNETAFIDCIDQVLNNQDMARQISLSARKKAEEYDWNNVRLLWENLFSNIAEN